VPEYRTFQGRKARLPTAAEKRREWIEAGVADVVRPLEQAPETFWEAILKAAHWQLASSQNLSSMIGRDWWAEISWLQGWKEITGDTVSQAFEMIVRHGRTPVTTETADPHVRLTAIELLIDTIDDAESTRKFESLANEAAERFHIGIRLEGTRFVDVTSEAIHQEVVRPVLILLSTPELKDIDELYRKAFERLRTEPGGAITAAQSAVHQMLRRGGFGGSSLRTLAERARIGGWITVGVEQLIVKLDAFRKDSDAHQVGTDEKELARLVVNVAGSIILYLGRTLPNAKG
jgi:hypothetical protein